MGDWIYYEHARELSIFTCILIALYGLVVALCFNPIVWHGMILASLFILFDIVIFFRKSWNFHCCTREMATLIFMPWGIASIILGVILACFLKGGFLNCWSIGAFSSGVIYLMITARLFNRAEHG